MKVGLIFPNNLYTSPYLPYYTQILEKEKVDYDIISWNRNNYGEKGTLAFTLPNSKGPKIIRLFDYYKFRKFVIATLKQHHYDKVLVFTCQLGIYLQGYLAQNYANNYLLDIRDYSPLVPYFKRKIKKLIGHAHAVCLSSNGFKTWLPGNGRYLLSHNVNIKLVREAMNNNQSGKDLFKSETIRVDTIGQIKDFDSDAKVVSIMGNDTRFQLKFMGFGPTAGRLEEFVTEKGINNVFLTGSYKKEEEQSLLEATDFINILISDSFFNNQVLSNRIYLSAMLRIPCLVNDYTVEQKKIIEKFNFGIVICDYQSIPDEILRFKATFDELDFKEACTQFLKEVVKDYDLFEKSLKAFFGN